MKTYYYQVWLPLEPSDDGPSSFPAGDLVSYIKAEVEVGTDEAQVRQGVIHESYVMAHSSGMRVAGVVEITPITEFEFDRCKQISIADVMHTSDATH